MTRTEILAAMVERRKCTPEPLRVKRTMPLIERNAKRAHILVAASQYGTSAHGVNRALDLLMVANPRVRRAVAEYLLNGEE